MKIEPDNLPRAIPTTSWACSFLSGQIPERISLKFGDGYETVLYVHHPPAGAAVELPVLQLHGIQSHPGWFGASAAATAKAGRPVYQLTRRGSGENAAARSDAPSARRLLEDVREACRFVLHREKCDQLNLAGISWGGKLAACHCCDSQAATGVASLTLIAPGIVPRVDLPLAKKLAVAWSLATEPRRLFDIPLSDVELFTDNPAMRDYLRQDPLRLHQATARFLFISRKLDLQLRRAKAGAIRPPVTLLLAKRDRIIDNARTQAMVEKLARAKVRVLMFDAAHTLEFEADAKEFANAAWTSCP
jgi:alpha-beta hydrolase superfamily lysophospholipase